MALLPSQFNASGFVPKAAGAGQLPVGRHRVIVENSEIKAIASGAGNLLQMTIRVIEGPAQGATGLYRLNMWHTGNPKTVEIANEQFAAIAHAVKVPVVTDTAQLHNIPFVVDVMPQQNEPKFTEIKRVYAEDAVPATPGPVAAPAPAAQAWNAQVQQAQAPAQAFQPQQPAQQQPQQWATQQQPAQHQPVQQQQPQQTWQQPQQPAQPAQAWAQQPQQPAQQQPAQTAWTQQAAAAGGQAPWGG